MAISTRLHGLIDWGVAASLGGAALGVSMPPPVRRVVVAASLAPACYALLTDYEAGLVGWLSMRRHLALDVASGALLCAAGGLLRRQPSAARAALAVLGAAELLVAASTSRIRGVPDDAGPPADAEVGYPPFDRLKPVADGLFIVDSLMPGMLGRMLPVRMTVIRLPDGDLLLHSPTRYDAALRRELEAVGRIRHLVAPNIAHWMFLQDWQRACPDALAWAVPGLRRRRQVRRSGLRLDRDLGDTAPAEWGDAVVMNVVPGGLGLREIALFHVPTRTLVLTDLVLNLQVSRLPAPVRPLARLFGVVAPNGMPPPYIRAVFRLKRRDAAAAATRLLDLAPERVVLAHGEWFQADGRNALRRSFRWLLG